MIIINTYWTWKRKNPHVGGDNRMIKTTKIKEINNFWVRNKNNNNNNNGIWVWIRIRIKIKQRTIRTRDTLISSRKRKCPHPLLKVAIIIGLSNHRLSVLIKYPWTNKIPTLIEITIITHTLNILMKAIIKAIIKHINPLNPPSQPNKPSLPFPNTAWSNS